MEIKAEIGQEFVFRTNILRAVEENGSLYLEGVASSTNKDQHNTIFSDICQRGFVEDVNSGNIVIDIKHSNDFVDFIGRCESANITTEDNTTYFNVRIKLNDRNPQAKYLYDVIREPKVDMGEPSQLGLSIMGSATKWHINEDGVTVFDRVKLKRIAITESPSNTDTFVNVIERSILKEVKMSEELKETAEVVEQPQIEVDREEVAPQEEQPQIEEVKEEVVREIEFDENYKVVASSLRMSIDEQVSKMVKNIQALQNANNLDVDMLLLAIEEFTEYFAEEFEDLMWAVEWCGVSDAEVQREAKLNEQKQAKSNLVESIKSIKVERMAEQKTESVVETVNETQVEAEVVREEVVPQAQAEVESNDESKELVREMLAELKAIKSQNEELKREIEGIKQMPTSSAVMPQEVVREKVDTFDKNSALKQIFGIR